jgi:hypothetical protein
MPSYLLQKTPDRFILALNNITNTVDISFQKKPWIRIVAYHPVL